MNHTENLSSFQSSVVAGSCALRFWAICVREWMLCNWMGEDLWYQHLFPTACGTDIGFSREPSRQLCCAPSRRGSSRRPKIPLAHRSIWEPFWKSSWEPGSISLRDHLAMDALRRMYWIAYRGQSRILWKPLISPPPSRWIPFTLTNTCLFSALLQDSINMISTVSCVKAETNDLLLTVFVFVLSTA